MKGWLIYSPAGIRRNRWFAERLMAEAKARGVELGLRLVPDVVESVAEEYGEVVGPPRELVQAVKAEAPDFAVVRLIRPDVSEFLESAGVRCVNNALTSRVANDKWRTFELARELGLPVMDTFRCSAGWSAESGFPWVVKSRDGHGGGEVALVGDAAEFSRFAAGLHKRHLIAQPLCSDPGRDIRVYALRGEVVGAVLRTSRHDFRSNFSLGGEVSAVEATVGQREMVRMLHDRLRFDFVGVDFILHNGEWVLNEIEDVVGCRMLYATTGRDAAAMLARVVCDFRV